MSELKHEQVEVSLPGEDGETRPDYSLKGKKKGKTYRIIIPDIDGSTVRYNTVEI